MMGRGGAKREGVFLSGVPALGPARDTIGS